jgi:dTDP-4-dehydrorhamnose 3,5-epimerase
MSFRFLKLNIPDVILVEPVCYVDLRGYFLEMFKSLSFNQNGIEFRFSQENLSFSKKGTVRGMHFQKHPYEQGKLVSIITGSIFDVAVDLRINSQTFGKYVYANLSEENHKSLWIPPGFGHGFMAIEDSHVIYKVTNEYNKEYDSGIVWNDSDIGIVWPAIKPIISDKDKELMTFKHYIRENRMIS